MSNEILLLSSKILLNVVGALHSNNSKIAFVLILRMEIVSGRCQLMHMNWSKFCLNIHIPSLRLSKFNNAHEVALNLLENIIANLVVNNVIQYTASRLLYTQNTQQIGKVANICNLSVSSRTHNGRFSIFTEKYPLE